MHKYLCELGAYLMKKLFEKFISKTEAYLNFKKELMEKEQKINELEKEKSYLANLSFSTPSAKIEVAHIERIKLRMFYDSTWLIIINTPTGLNRITIVRHDCQKKESLIAELKKCSSIEEIYALDEKDRIYYD